MSMEKWWNAIGDRKNGRNPEKNLARPFIVYHETHTERIRGPSGERRASNLLRHEAAPDDIYLGILVHVQDFLIYGKLLINNYHRIRRKTVVSLSLRKFDVYEEVHYMLIMGVVDREGKN